MTKHHPPEHFKPYAGSLPCAHAPLAGELVLLRRALVINRSTESRITAQMAERD